MKTLLRYSALVLIALFIVACQSKPRSASASNNQHKVHSGDGIYFDQDYPYNKKQASKKSAKRHAAVKKSRKVIVAHDKRGISGNY